MISHVTYCYFSFNYMFFFFTSIYNFIRKHSHYNIRAGQCSTMLSTFIAKISHAQARSSLTNNDDLRLVGGVYIEYSFSTATSILKNLIQEYLPLHPFLIEYTFLVQLPTPPPPSLPPFPRWGNKYYLYTSPMVFQHRSHTW